MTLPNANWCIDFFRWNHQWFSFQNKKNVSAILVYQRSIISSFIVLCHVYQENMWIHSTHHWLNVHEFEQTPGDSEGQGSLPCCSPWDCKESDTITTVILIVYLNVTVFRKLLECYWMNPVKHMQSFFFNLISWLKYSFSFCKARDGNCT